MNQRYEQPLENVSGKLLTDQTSLAREETELILT
jgi:hypothetical protein